MPEIYADSIEAKVDGTNQIVPIRDITKAPAIIASTSGESIQLSDSGVAPLTDIKLYGKSKQDGEPSPDNPVEIEIPGSERNVEITASDGDEQIKNVTLPTPNGLPGIPVTSGGNYTDSDGQQWVCDEIDFKRGKYVQRVLKKNVKLYYVEYSNNAGYRYTHTYADGLYKGAELLSTKFKYNENASNNMGDKTSEGIRNSETYNMIVAYSDERIKEGINTDILIQLSAPIETDLTIEQLTALKQLRTYQTVTNITTDSEPQVGMEVEYTADTKTYIDNKMNEIQTQLLNMKTQEV